MGNFFRTSTFSGSTWRPPLLTKWPGNCTIVWKKEQFAGMIFKLALWKRCKTWRSREICSSGVLQKIMQSSKYGTHDLRLDCQTKQIVFHQILQSVWASRGTHWHGKIFKGTKMSTDNGDVLTGCVHWELIKTCGHVD